MGWVGSQRAWQGLVLFALATALVACGKGCVEDSASTVTMADELPVECRSVTLPQMPRLGRSYDGLYGGVRGAALASARPMIVRATSADPSAGLLRALSLPDPLRRDRRRVYRFDFADGEVPARALHGVRLRLARGGLKVGARVSVEVTAFREPASQEAVERTHRTLRADLTMSDEGATLTVDVSRALLGNWGDTVRRGASSLRALEVALGEAGDAKVASVELLDGRAAIDERAGAVPPRAIDVAGEYRLGWRLAKGERLTHDAVAGAQVVSFFLASLAGAPELSLAFVGADGRSLKAQRLAPSPAWTHHVLIAPEGTLGIRVESRGGGTAALASLSVRDGAGSKEDARGASREAPVDVVVYLVDTLVAPALGAYGNRNDVPVSPTIDRLAQQGVIFANVMSASPWTKPSVVSILTGLMPDVHRVGATGYTDRLPDAVPTLPERFAGAGFATAAFLANPLACQLSGLEGRYQFAHCPEYYGDGRALPLGVPEARDLHRAYGDWLKQQVEEAKRGPTFAMIHSLDVHEYASKRYSRAGDPSHSAYERAIHAQDTALAELLAQHNRRFPERELLLVLLSDHGEAFGAFGREGHGYSLYQSQLHVPLIVHSSRGRMGPAHDDGLASLLDVAPSLLALFALPPLEPQSPAATLGAEGQRYSLFDHAREPRVVHASRLWYPWDPSSAVWRAALWPTRQKVMSRDDDPLARAFDLDTDPCEQRASAATAAQLERFRGAHADFAARRRAYAERYGIQTAATVDEVTAAQLRSLGYVPDEARPASATNVE